MPADRSDDSGEPPAKPADLSADQAEAPDAPSGEQPDRSPDRADAPADHVKQSRREQIEPRSREEAWTALRGPAAEERTEPAARSEPAESTENGQQAPAADASREKTADKPLAERSDRSTDPAEAPTNDAKLPGRPPTEPPKREESHTDLRAVTELEERTELAGPSEPGARSKPAEQAGNRPQAQAGASWEETVEESRWIWGKYKSHFPDEERPPVDRSKDPSGSWRADVDSYLDPRTNERIEAECDRIEVREEERILPALRAIESQDIHRHLIGFEHHLKGRDRIKEKICRTVTDFHRSPEQAVSLLPDTLRYTFQYEDDRYTRGVYEDIARLQEQGFKLEISKNTWSDDQYKGINSQWIEPVSGQRFEVQFHTHISYEAKQLTHPAYERIREWPKPDKFEQMVLEAFQRKVTAEVPIPSGAGDIPDYPKRGTDAR